MSDDWTEKYRPKTLSNVVGNPSATSELRSWANSWKDGIPKKRAIVLIGTPGIGKTSSALALANDMGWDPVEMNASDQRTGDAIKNIATRGAISNTFSLNGEYLDSKLGGRKLIILDEADNLFGNADRGALPAINELIKTTKQPVILIVNDFYALSRKSNAIKTDTIQITFRRPTSRAIIGSLNNIAMCENITVDPKVMEKIAENSNGDLRAAIRDLESLSYGVSVVSAEKAQDLSERIVRTDMYDLMNSIFRKSDVKLARSVYRNAGTDPDTACLWIDENLPYEYKDAGDLVRGYEKLAKADVFLGRVHRRQYFGMWSYAGDMMTAGVTTARFSQIIAHDKFKFPQYLIKMSRSKSIRSLRNSICYKLAVYLHTSTKRIKIDVLPSIEIIAKNNHSFRVMLIRNVSLEPEELGFIIGKKMDSDEVKIAFLEVTTENMRAKTDEQVIDVEEPPPTIESKPIKKPQKSLFDF